MKKQHRSLQTPTEAAAILNRVRNGTFLIEQAIDMAAVITASKPIIEFWEANTHQGPEPATKKRKNLSPIDTNPDGRAAHQLTAKRR